mgnify:FL=1
MNSPVLSVSQSELRMWRDCKRKWYLTYYLGLKRKNAPVSDVMNLGTRIHKALECYYRDGSDPLHALDLIYDAAQDTPAVMNDDGHMEWSRNTNLDDEHTMARIMVDGYMQWIAETGIDSDLEVISAEEDLRVPGPIEGTELRAKLDLRVRRKSDGARLFLDHKTKASFKNAQQVLHIDGQMRFYALMEYLDGREEWTDGGLFNVLRRVKRTARSKPPYYIREPVKYTAEDIRSEWLRVNIQLQEIIAVRAALDARPDHRYAVYPSPCDDCSWKCFAFHVCPLMDDGSRYEEMFANEFVVGDPYQYYDDGIILEGLRKLG